MGRFSATVESQAAQAAGVPVTVTFNGYFAALVAGAAANYRLRRIFLGVRAGFTVPTSQQMTVAIYRQTARPTGSGFSTTAGANMDTLGAATAVTGIDVTTATTAGTTGPTLGTLQRKLPSFNTQTGLDIPFEFLEELTCPQGTANGLAFVNIGNQLPPSHLYTLDLEWEE